MTQLHLDLKKLTHNYTTLKGRLKATTKIMAVVKADAYGLGAIALSKHLISLGTDWLAVAYAQEGVTLRKAGIDCPIVVFYPQFERIDSIINNNLEPALFSTAFIEAFATALKQKKRMNYPVHLKCNTGLNRIGLSASEVDDFLTKKNDYPFRLKSVYSHLGASEDPRPNTFTQKQITSFLAIKKKVEKTFTNPPLFHLLNTSGVFNYPEFQMDLVRIGIGLYGFANRAEWDQLLQPIANLSSRVVQIHLVQKGESVGYNQGWIAQKESRIGVLPLGHADGISRQFGKGVGGVWINGKRAPIVGNVCMDMLMVDLTEIDCEPLDPAMLFDHLHTAHEFAEQAGTISYELLTSLSPRIQRVINN